MKNPILTAAVIAVVAILVITLFSGPVYDLYREHQLSKRIEAEVHRCVRNARPNTSDDVCCLVYSSKLCEAVGRNFDCGGDYWVEAPRPNDK